ncbi:SseB family protein [Galactobacter sp.]|uniref:SseB family protein n=1 Tax=Galactobacter sp. TaxID=2676125 RepID=UPI0025C15CF2|nr:SseB family protein [Galactobacter sp.]
MTTEQPAGLPDPDDFDAAEAAKAVGEGGRLMQSFVKLDQEPDQGHDLALISDFYGTRFLVPVLAVPEEGERPRFATFEADGKTILGVSLREQDATHLHRSVAEAEGRADDALNDPILVEMLGDELVETAFASGSFAATGIDRIAVDPLGLGISIASDDELLEFDLRSGALRRAVHQGKDAVLAYLLEADAVGVAMHNGDGAPLLMRRPSDGAQVFPLFSSAMEVFRFNEDVATREITAAWLRTALPAGMHLLVDVSGGDAIEFSPEELEKAGFRIG